MDDHTGQQFGNYRVLRLLGEGSSAEVYLGKHLHLRSLAAIKVLHMKLLERERLTFMNEARIIAKLDHPSIIRVLDSDFVQGHPYVVMNYAPGGTLRQRHPKGSCLPPELVISYVNQVAAALQYAHDRHIVHRDVKPQNMLLGRNDRVLQSDFGIALVSSASITQGPQMVTGSVAYMAPEQIMGKSQPASDQYALAAVVYEWLTGEQLFQGSFSELCAQHLYAPPPPLQEKNPAVSSAIEDVIIKALAKDPAQRFASIQEFADALMPYALESPLAVSSLPDVPGAEQATDEDDATIRKELPGDSNVLPVAPYIGQSELAAGDTVAESDTVDLTPAISAQATHEDLLADTDKIAIAVALKPADVVEQEQAEPTIPLEDDESTQPRVPRVVVDTPALSFPALSALSTFPAEWRKKLSDIPLWNRASERGKRTLVIIASLLLLLILSSVAYALPRIGGKGFGQTATPAPTSLPLTAAVMITPQQKEWNKTYKLSAVMGTPHSTQHQVQAHWLSVTSAAQSQTVKATGIRNVPGTGVAATGLLTFDNTAAVPLTLNRGTVLTNSLPTAPGPAAATGPLQMILDAPLTVPAASAAQPHALASVAAHVVQIGIVGNIAAGRFMTTGRVGVTPTPNWSVINLAPFAGGVDMQTETYVKQSDIDTTAKTLIRSNTPEPAQVLKPEIHATEQLVGQGWCTPNQQADHKANEKAATVTVSVSFTCVGDVYDHDRSITLTTNLLREDMKTAHYTVAKTIKVTTKQKTIADDQGKIALQMQAQANGTYSFDDTARQALAHGIAGKSISEAQNWLKLQQGVGNATITLAGGTGKKLLPTRIQDITVTIAA